MNEQIDAVQRMQDYIHEHVNEKLDMAKLAKQAGYSPWHARRLFIKHLEITPADYIRKVRLRKSALLLRDRHIRVLDAALMCGFESTDGYQRAFLNEFGCNPTDYEKYNIPIPLYTPYGIKTKKAERKNKEMNTNNVFLTVVHKPARKVIIKRGIEAKEYWSYCQEVGCDVWGILTSIKSDFGEPVCLWLPKQYIRPGTSEYVQGIEVSPDYKGMVPEGFDVIELPEADYLMFNGEPFEEENFEQAITEIWEAEKKYNPSVIGYQWDGENPRIQMEPIGTRGYIELLAIRRL